MTQVIGSLDSPAASDRVVRSLMVGVVLAVVLTAGPVLIKGAPLHDDFLYCLEPKLYGLSDFLGRTIDFYGAVRPARLLEIITITSLCHNVPFGVVIAIPLTLTVVGGLLLRNLVRSFDVASPWPEIAACAWLLQPLGTESSLWPSALHVPLGLALSLWGLLRFRKLRPVSGALLTLAAVLSLEQLIFALPIAAWLVTPPNGRKTAALAAGFVCLAVLGSYAQWSGLDPRAAAGLGERVRNVFSDVDFYVLGPAAALGGYSIPAGTLWGLPWSVVALAGGGLLGAYLARRILHPVRVEKSPLVPTIASFAVLLAAVNLPLAVTLPHQDSPRVFTATWMIIAAGIGIVGHRLLTRRVLLVGILAGVLGAGALVSQTFSVWVRVETATRTERAMRSLAERVPEEGVIAMCGIQRSVMDDAPPGDFSGHEFLGEGTLQEEFAEPAYLYYTDRRAEFRLPGLEKQCPSEEGADIVVDFTSLLSQ